MNYTEICIPPCSDDKMTDGDKKHSPIRWAPAPPARGGMAPADQDEEPEIDYGASDDEADVQHVQKKEEESNGARRGHAEEKKERERNTSSRRRDRKSRESDRDRKSDRINDDRSRRSRRR